MSKIPNTQNPIGDFSERPVRSEQTRLRLAEALKECMKTSSVDNITVRQITQTCGITRQTFYRNFLDKYDLINWYFDKLLLESFARMGSGETIYEGLVRKFYFIRLERVFFTAAFHSDAQNSLKEHDFELILKFYTDLIQKKSGQLPSKETLFLLEMYCHGSIYMTVRWVLGGMKDSPELLARLLVRAMPSELTQLFVSLQILS